MHSHYETLFVNRSAPLEVIRAAHKALSQKWHPDRNNAPDAAETMQTLNRARDVLLNDQARAAYDADLAQAEAMQAEWANPRVHWPEELHPTGEQTSAVRSGGFTVDDVALAKALSPHKSISEKLMPWLWASGIVGVMCLTGLISGH